MIADDAPLHGRTDNEEVRPGTMVGPLAAVLVYAPAEFRVRQKDDARSVLRLLKDAEELLNRPGQLREQLAVRCLLIAVRVEPVERDIVQPRAEIGLDQLR